VSGSDAPSFPLLSKLLAIFFFIFLPVLKEPWGLDHGRVSWGHSINSSWAVSLERVGASGWVSGRPTADLGMNIRYLTGVWVERKGELHRRGRRDIMSS
jgi:hypothetical protein